MTKLWKDLNPDSINWKQELELTLAETGWTKVHLAEVLGLYIQRRKERGGDVSPHFYNWLSGKYKPKPYLIYALRYIRLIEGNKPRRATKAPPKA